MAIEKTRVSAGDATRNFRTILRRLNLQPGQRVELRDDDVSGLILRIAADGSGSWNVRTRTRDGKQTRPRLGSYPGMGLAQARLEARQVLAKISAGGDPVQERRDARAARAAKSTERTLTQAFDEWIAVRERDRAKRLADRTIAEYRRVFTIDILPRIGSRHLRELTRQDWSKLIAEKRRTAPGQATTMYRTISGFLGFAEVHGWIDHHPLPRRGLSIMAPPPKPRQRTLSDGEIVELLRASNELTPRGRAFLRLLILTGARREQVARLRVGDVNHETHVLTLRAETGSKNYKERVLPLGRLAMDTINSIWPAEVSDADFGIIGARGGIFGNFHQLRMRLVELVAEHRAKIAADTGVAEVAMPAWRWHDLRRSIRTSMAAMGVTREVAELVCGRVADTSATVGTYNRHDYAQEIETASLRWQSHVESLLLPAGPTVVPFRKPA
ncbi:MAG: integrase family protein [Verrucomicrobia bacterium]|nr:integrase family protein [Verrucomicrobiota bacterium]